MMDHDFLAALGALKRRADAADLPALAGIIETLEREEQADGDLEPETLRYGVAEA